MKKIIKSVTCFVCAVLCLLTFSACGKDEGDVYSNMTKSGFNNYLTNEETTTKFSNYEVNIVERVDRDETLEINLKTRTLGGKSIGIATYKSGGLNVNVYISQDKVYFKFKNSSGTVIDAQNHIVNMDFFAKQGLTGLGLNVNETIVIKSLYDCLTGVDVQNIYTKIKDETTRLEEEYSIKMSIKNNYDKFKINYSAEEESTSFAEEYSINTYFEFYKDTINKIEYIKSGKQIDNTAFSNYEYKMIVTGFDGTITLPAELGEENS